MPEPTYTITERAGSLEIKIELPLVDSASEIDAYAESQQLEVSVEGLYALCLPLDDEVSEDDLCCKWSKQSRTLTVTFPIVVPPQPAVHQSSDHSSAEELKEPESAEKAEVEAAGEAEAVAVVGLEGFAGGSEGWKHSTAAVTQVEERQRHGWARHRSSDVLLTGAHVPLTPEQVAQIEGRRASGKGSGHVPVPLAKEKAVREAKVRVSRIDQYAFLDDGAKVSAEPLVPNSACLTSLSQVKIYIELAGIGKLKDLISCNFELNSFDLLIQDSKDSHRRLHVDPLAQDIWPEKSKITVKSNKIIVSLHKQDASTKWHKLVQQEPVDK